MMGATGYCKKYGNPYPFIHDYDDECLGNKKGKKKLKKMKCGLCKHFDQIQDPSIINSHMKEKCVYECEHYSGFYNDHKNWIDCNVQNNTCRYFANDPYSLGRKFGKDVRWIGYCTDFKQRIEPVIRYNRFDNLIE